MFSSKGIYIDPQSGNIGIGTTIPLSLFHVEGTISASNVNVIGEQTTINSSTINSDRLSLSNLIEGPALSVEQRGFGAIANFYDSNLLLMTVSRRGEGSVGIGTTLTSARFEVVGPYTSGYKTTPLVLIRNPQGNQISSILKIYDKDNDDPTATEAGSSFTIDMSANYGLVNLCAGCELINGTINGYTYCSTRGASRILMGDGAIQFYNGTDTGQTYGSNVTFASPMTLSNVYVIVNEKVLASDGLSGISLNTTTRRVNLVYNNWTFEVEGSVLTPIGKTRVVYNATGGDQTFTVPTGVTHIYVKMWGAGGGNGRAGGWSYGADAGGGGHSRGLIPVTAGENLTIKVGVGGRTVVYGTAYGGGAGAVNTSDTSYGGQGGGGSYIFRGGTPLLIAGGGGGGGSSRSWDSNRGGAGGGLQGQKGNSPFDGRWDYGGMGGTQSAGGYGTNGRTGTQYQGGSPNVNSYGGGGGGGYWGGGGGGYAESNTMGGGGGGSGYVDTTVLLGGTFTGMDRVPAFYWDNDLDRYQSNNTSRGFGGLNTQNNLGGNAISGGNGYIVIYY